MPAHETFYEVMRQHGITRRSFLKFCSLTAAGLGLGPEFAGKIAHALETKPRTPVIWLHGLECTCCTESFIRSGNPLAGDVILSMISLDYDDTLMAAAGHQAEELLEQTVEKYDGQYILACEGNPPLNEDGMYCIQARQALRREAHAHGRSLQGDHRLGFLRVLGLRAGGTAESDAGDADPQGHLEQAGHQGARLPADRRSHDRRHHLHDRLRSAAGTRSPGPAEDVLQPAPARQVLPAAALRRRPVRRDASTTRARARATACTRSAARDRRPTTPARPSSGTTACRGRSSRATAASAAPRTISGTRARSTARSPISASWAGRSHGRQDRRRAGRRRRGRCRCARGRLGVVA